MASPEAIVKNLVHRLSSQPEMVRRLDGHNKPTSLEGLRDTVQTVKDMENLVDVVSDAKNLLLAKSALGDQGLRLLVRAFKEGSRRGSNLRHLDLTNNGITKLGFEALTEALGSGYLPKLEHLILSQNRIGEDGIAMLSKVLGHGRHSSLRGLDLSHCFISDEGLVNFSLALQSGKFSSWELQSLDLSANTVGGQGTDSLAKAIFMGRLPRLMFLNLSHNKIGEQGTAALSSVISAGKLSALTHLLLARCSLSDSLVPIARALERGNLRNLQVLDVCGNHMGDQGSVALAIAMRTGAMPRLQHLNLSQCGLGGYQVDFITKAIEAGQIWGLQHLDLSRNSIDSLNSDPATYSIGMINNHGSVALARVIERGCLNHLQYLDLSQCSITDHGLITLAVLMKSGKLRSLQYFLFQGNEVTEKESVKALVRALESGELPHLQEIELGQNSSGEDVTMALASALTVSSAQGPLVERLKERLLKSQKSLGDKTVAAHLTRFWRSRSFRGLEPIKVDEKGLRTEEKIFNKFLERQYSSRLPPVVDEGMAPATTSKFVFNVLVVLSWLFALLVSKRIS